MNPLPAIAFAPQITAAAQRNNLDPKLLAAVAAQETGGPGALSGRNIVGDGGHGHGLFQIDDRWHRFASTPAAMDPDQNANYAAGLLSGLLKTYGGDVRMALSAYNAGSPTATGTTTDWGNGKVVGYADSVLMHYAEFGGGATTARDAAIPDAAATAADTNSLRAAAAASPVNATPAAPAPAIPATSDHGSHEETALTEDLGLADDSELDPRQPTISS